MFFLLCVYVVRHEVCARVRSQVFTVAILAQGTNRGDALCAALLSNRVVSILSHNKFYTFCHPTFLSRGFSFVFLLLLCRSGSVRLFFIYFEKTTDDICAFFHLEPFSKGGFSFLGCACLIS